jgi:hypothetical protein
LLAAIMLAGVFSLGLFAPALPLCASTQKPSGQASRTPPEAKERFEEAFAFALAEL